jgi:sRNA-binding carbon storage regulator CsrA
LKLRNMIKAPKTVHVRRTSIKSKLKSQVKEGK